MEGKSILVPGKSKVVNINPMVKSLTKLEFGSSTFKSDTFGPREFKSGKLQSWYLDYGSLAGKNLETSLERITFSVPPKLVNAKIVLVKYYSKWTLVIILIQTQIQPKPSQPDPLHSPGPITN